MTVHSFIEIDRAAESCIQGNFERLHVALTLINNFSYFCDLPVDLRLIAFQAFHCAVMRKVKEGLADLVPLNTNQTRCRRVW